MAGEKIAFSFPRGMVYILDTMTGKQLRQARGALQLTQKGLAEALDLSKNHVAMMERDEAPIRRVTEFAIKHLLTAAKQREEKKRKR